MFFIHFEFFVWLIIPCEYGFYFICKFMINNSEQICINIIKLWRNCFMKQKRNTIQGFVLVSITVGSKSDPARMFPLSLSSPSTEINLKSVNNRGLDKHSENVRESYFKYTHQRCLFQCSYQHQLRFTFKFEQYTEIVNYRVSFLEERKA